jgi:hypothetical protein
VHARHPRNHDAPVHADVGAAVVDVAGVVGDDVFEDEDGLRDQRSVMGQAGTITRVHSRRGRRRSTKYEGRGGDERQEDAEGI